MEFWNIQNAICKAGFVLAHMLHDLIAVNEEEPNEFGSRLLDKVMEALDYCGYDNVNLNFRR